MTDQKNWDGYIEGKLWTGGCKFTKEFLEDKSSWISHVFACLANKAVAAPFFQTLFKDVCIGNNLGK